MRRQDQIQIGIFALFWLFLFCTSAEAITVWADPSGNATCAQATSVTDPGPGRYRKLHRASDNGALGCLQNAGDTLMLKAGNYNSTDDNFFYGNLIPTGTPTNYTKIKCEKPKACINQQFGSGTVIEYYTPHEKYIEFDGILFRSKSYEGSMAKILDGNFSAHPTCYDCGPGYIRFINGGFDGRCDVLDCNGCYGCNCFLGGSPGIQFLNMEIYNCNYGLYYSYGDADGLIASNWFHHNTGFAVHMYCNPSGGCGGGCGCNPTPIQNVVVRDNLMEFNGSLVTGPPGFTNCMSTLLVADGGNRKVYNNVIRNGGQEPPIGGPQGTCGGGLVVYQGSSNDVFYNNTIYNNRGGAIYISPSTSNLTFINNIVWGNNLAGHGCPGDPGGCDIHNDGGPTANFSSNIIGAIGRSPTTSGSISQSGTISNNPLITSSSDARLQAGSPAINSGQNLSGVFTTDAAGTSRPQ